MLAEGQKNLFLGESDYHRSIIESFVFLTINLEDRDWTRTELAEITRAVNRLFPMPAIIIFLYGGKLTLSVIPRRPNKKDNSRDVIEPTRKVALIKDVDLERPHRAHLDILTDLHIQAGVTAKKAPNISMTSIGLGQRSSQPRSSTSAFIGVSPTGIFGPWAQ